MKSKIDVAKEWLASMHEILSDKQDNPDHVMERIEIFEWLIEQTERVQELEDIIYKDERQAVLESMYEENKRYRVVIKKAIDDLESECLWDALVALKELEGDEELRI